MGQWLASRALPSALGAQGIPGCRPAPTAAQGVEMRRTQGLRPNPAASAKSLPCVTASGSQDSQCHPSITPQHPHLSFPWGGGGGSRLTKKRERRREKSREGGRRELSLNNNKQFHFSWKLYIPSSYNLGS